MTAVQYYFAQSLDGYIAESNHGLDWLMRYDGDSSGDVSAATDGSYDDFIAQVGALAMGSATYEVVLEAAESGWPYAGTPSWVFTSRELPVPEGADVRFVAGDVGPALEEMRAVAGERNIWVVGGGDLAMQFADAGLLDELHITIVPAILGAGIPAFSGRLVGRLRLLGVRPFRNGMAELRFAFRH